MSQITRLIATSGPGSGTVTSVSGGNNITITGNPAVNPTVNVSGTTNHAVQVGNATGSLTSLAVGTTGQVLTGVTGADPVWASPAASSITITGDSGGALSGSAFTFTGGTTGLTFSGAGTTETLTGTLVVANGGTGRATLTNHGLLVGAGTAAITQLANATDGQLPIGSTGADPVLATITAGTGISVTNGAGSITIAATGAGNPVTTLHTQDGNNVTATAGVINISGGNSLTTTGTAGPNTVTVGLSGVTQYNVQTGGAANALNNVAPTATSGIPLISQGAASQPIFGTAVVAGGGTGVVTLTNHGVLLGQGTSAIVATAVGTTGQVLTGVTGADPVWAAPAASSISITGNSGGALTGNAFTFTGGTTGLTFAGAGTTETLGGTLVVSNGGTGAATFTAHGVMLGEGTSALGVTAAGTTGQVLTGVTGADPVWASPVASSISITGDSGGALTGAAFTFTGGTTGLTFAGAGSTETLGGTLVVSNGGTGRATLTNHGLLVGAGTSAITQLANATNGQIPIGSTGADPVLATITAGSNITVTNGAGTITIAASGGTSFTWSVITADQTAAVNNGYFCNKAGTLALALPTTSALGDVIEVSNENTALGIQFTQASGQQILIGSSNTTSGATGTLTSSAVGDTLKIVCKTANTVWRVTSIVGNWSVV